MPSTGGSQVLREVPCYAYPEVREFRLAEAKELMDYDVDGIMYCAHNSHTGLARMAYVGLRNGGLMTIGLATSRDGINWTKDHRNPVLVTGPEN